METLISPDTSMLWSIDPSSSTITFSIKHVVVATAHGHFRNFQGTIQFADDQLQDPFVEVLIDADSIDTGIANRDAHLRSADFFDVATYPSIVFRSTRVERVNPFPHDRWHVVGDLTMHGVTRSVELDAERTDGDPYLWETNVISFAAMTKINRKDFGIGRNLPLEKGEFVIGDDVKIAITIQALRDLAKEH